MTSYDEENPNAFFIKHIKNDTISKIVAMLLSIDKEDETKSKMT